MQVFYLAIPPFVIHLETDISSVISAVTNFYRFAFKKINDSEAFADFHLKVVRVGGVRKYLRPQVQFFLDGKTPFKPLPLSQAYPFFEWGLNWCVASHVHQYLILHAAVVEKNNRALILPGHPGSGKSTLCAALVHSGWRLLSDEMAVVDPNILELVPVVRPISLKNESIEVISEFSKEVELGDSFFDTAKGTVTHMKPPSESIDKNTQKANAAWIVFPQYLKDSDSRLAKMKRGETVLELAKNSFNYNILGSKGFELLCDLVNASQCYQFEYSCLPEAIGLFDSLAESNC